MNFNYLYLRHERFPPCIWTFHLASFTPRNRKFSLYPPGKHPQRLFGFQEKENSKEKRENERALYIFLSVKHNMRLFFQEVISTPYIVFTKAKLVIGLLQGEERKLHQKIQKKISKVESAKIEENSHHTWGVRIFAHLRRVCEFRTPFAQLRGCANFAHHSHTIRIPGAVVFRRPYLPRFSSKSYTV